MLHPVDGNLYVSHAEIPDSIQINFESFEEDAEVLFRGINS